ncbi:MAG: S1/P1 nuclease [Verrucomicrobiota bacterium]
MPPASQSPFTIQNSKFKIRATTRALSLLLATLLLIPLLSPTPAHAWGHTGHRTTAQIAYNHLTPETKKAIEKIIGDESFIELSIWPDWVRSDPEWKRAEPWHYMSIDDDALFSKHVTPIEGDVLSKINDFEKVLKDPDATQEDKRDALAFYVHLVGDIHQPLHVGRKEDRGGNRILVEWFDEEVNLHRLWDENLVESMNLSYTELADLLDNATDKEIETWQRNTYVTWAKESQALRPQVYDFGKQDSEYFLNIQSAPELGWDYRYKNLPTLKKRLTQAGIRLAGKLNQIFDP